MTCFFSDEGDCDFYRPEDGMHKPDRAHMIPKRRLRDNGLTQYVWDERVWVNACRLHHTRFDEGNLSNQPAPETLPYEDYPLKVLSFAQEFGFFWTKRGWIKAAERGEIRAFYPGLTLVDEADPDPAA